MGQGGLDKHQLAGLDERERGFSRPVAFHQTECGYVALLRYESNRMNTEPHTTQDGALLSLIRMLHAHGYRQLRTQASFRGGVYLGSQEMWVEYPDPPPPPAPQGLLSRIAEWFRPPHKTTTSS